MPLDADLAKRSAKVLRDANSEEVKSPCYYILLGILDSLAEGRALSNSSLIFDLAIECSRHEDVNLPKDFSYVLGKCGFGIYDGRDMGRSRL